MVDIQRINPPGLAPPPGNRFAHVVRSGNLVWIAGQTSPRAGRRDNRQGRYACTGLAGQRESEDGNRIGGRRPLQHREGDNLPHPDADVEAARQAQNEYRDENALPASSMVFVHALVNPDYLIEVEAFAVVD